MDSLVKNVVAWGCADIAAALQMASATPAVVAGVPARKGKIAAGYDADVVALTAELAVRETWVAGRCVYKSEDRNARS
jgi:N-acetylglucosamine-6-phosphate deacetylase